MQVEKILLTFELSIKRILSVMEMQSTKISVRIPESTIRNWKKRLDNYGEKTACSIATGISRQTIMQAMKKRTALRDTVEAINAYVESK